MNSVHDETKKETSDFYAGGCAQFFWHLTAFELEISRIDKPAESNAPNKSDVAGKMRRGSMRKKVFYICLLVFLVLSLKNKSFASGSEYKLYFDITFRENLLFDKYDVELYLDNEQVGELKYAVSFTCMTSAIPGKHTVIFYKSGNHDVFGLKEITIEEDCSFRGMIQTEGKKITIIESELEASLSGSSIRVEDMSNMFLTDAIKILESAGFKNIVYKSDSGSEIKKLSNWIVISQNVAPGEQHDQNDEILLTCQKIDSFLEELSILNPSFCKMFII